MNTAGGAGHCGVALPQAQPDDLRTRWPSPTHRHDVGALALVEAVHPRTTPHPELCADCRSTARLPSWSTSGWWPLLPQQQPRQTLTVTCLVSTRPTIHAYLRSCEGMP